MPHPDSFQGFPVTLGEEPRFCPACGRPVEPRMLEADHRPRLVCPEGHVTWRNPRVVVGTLPVEGGRVYLGRRAIEPALGHTAAAAPALAWIAALDLVASGARRAVALSAGLDRSLALAELAGVA